MENAAPSRSDQRSTVTLGELLESTWKSLWSTPVVMWMRQPMRRTSVSGWMESMRESTRSLAGRSISVGPIVVGVRRPLEGAAEPMKPIRPPVAPNANPVDSPSFPTSAAAAPGVRAQSERRDEPQNEVGTKPAAVRLCKRTNGLSPPARVPTVSWRQVSQVASAERRMAAKPRASISLPLLFMQLAILRPFARA